MHNAFFNELARDLRVWLTVVIEMNFKVNLHKMFCYFIIMI